MTIFTESDTALVVEDATTAPIFGNVLTNDSSSDGSALRVTHIGGSSSNVGKQIFGAYGTLIVQADGSYQYQLDNSDGDTQRLGLGSVGSDWFIYSVANGLGESATAELRIDVQGRNDAPLAAADRTYIEKAKNVDTTSGSVLSNDTDVDADSLHVTSVRDDASAVGRSISGTFGHITLQSNGTYTYTLDRSDADTIALRTGQSATDTFEYSIGDGKGGASSSSLTVNIAGFTSPPSPLPVPTTPPPVERIGERLVLAGSVGPPTNLTSASLTSGSAVVAWKDANSVKIQLISSDGSQSGAQIDVAEARAGSAVLVSALASGSFVVSWYGSAGATARIYDGNGHAVGADFQIAKLGGYWDAAPIGNGFSMSSLASGGFVVVWQAAGPSWSPFFRSNDGEIKAQMFDRNGTKVGPEIDATATVGHQTLPKVLSLASGGFVATWLSSATGGTGQVFDASGAKVGTEFQASGADSLASLSSGGFVAVWKFYDEASSQHQIKLQRFDGVGQKVGLEVLVSAQNTAGAVPAVISLSSGGFAVAWDGVKVALFDASGARLGYDFDVEDASGLQISPSMVGFSNNRVLITWTESGGGSGSEPGVNGQFLTLESTNGADILVGGSINDVIYGLAGNDNIRAGDGQDLIDGGDGDDVIRGEGGHDRLFGGSGHDSLEGGEGSDTLVGGTGDDQLAGGGGDDTVIFVGKRSDYNVSLLVDTLIIGDRSAGRDGTDRVTGAETFRFSDSVFSSADLLKSVISGTEAGETLDVGGNSLPHEIIGLGGADHLLGGTADDYIHGGVGSDMLRGRGGSDVLDGGTGMDTAVYSGLFRSYEVHVQGAAGSVAGGAEGGTDTLASIEFLQFQDGVFVFDADGVAAQVTRLYDTVLQRGPDQVGLDYWVDRLEDQGGTLKQIAAGFLNSAEFQALTGQLSNGDYVDFLYQNALGRSSDVDGKSYWVGQLQSGVQDRADLLIGFSESQEHRDLTAEQVGHGFFNTDDNYQAVALLYDTFSGRKPDAGGLIYWAEGIEHGTFTLDQVADGFADSPEFRELTSGMSNSQIVSFLYQNTLDRPADHEGLNYWTARLDAGMDRGDLLLGFSQSYEHFNLLGAHVTSGIDYLS